MRDLIEALQDKDPKKAHALLKELLVQSAASAKYYPEFEAFTGLLSDKNSYVRTRGFLLCCAQARWDTSGMLARALPVMFPLLHDEKPTVVRQCLGALREVALFRPELCGAIAAEVDTIDLSGYRDSMSPLIRKDMDALLAVCI